MYKNKLKLLFILSIVTVMFQGSLAEATENSCVLLKFTDKTRFYKIGTADILSEMILEKLFSSGKFTFKETKAIDIESEKALYDENATIKKNADIALQTKNYDVLFEGEGFSNKKAENIGEAKKGQVLSPDITRTIGKQHDANYIIQGSIDNIGTGRNVDEAFGQAASALGNTLSVFGASGAGSIIGAFGGSSTEEKFLGVLVSLRLIKADSGEVIWSNRVIGKSKIKEHSDKSKSIRVGSNKLSSEVYTKALDDAAEMIVQMLVADTVDKGLLKN